MKQVQSRLKRKYSNTQPKRYNRNNQSLSLLDPESLVKKALPLPEKSDVHIQQRKFSTLAIDERLKSRILKKGFEHLTEIQDKTFELLCAGNDIVGIANTGTGKTGAFLIPVIQQLLTTKEPFQTLIMVPTRELALQVEEEFKSLTKDLNLYCTCIIGGTNINQDIKRLQRTSHIIVGTPGRITDLINRKALRIRSFSKLILDEFDRMLDMGFVNDVMNITNEMRNRTQTMLFSATENQNQDKVVNRLLTQPKRVKVSSGTSSADHIEQKIVRIAKNENKFDVMLNIIKGEGFEKVIVFAETKRRVAGLAVKLRKAGITSDEIHGNKSQAHRKKALMKFRTGNVQVLVATDVAARGIDVDNVTHVINYQIPQNRESYVHRIGRTGRAGKNGNAITLID